MQRIYIGPYVYVELERATADGVCYPGLDRFELTNDYETDALHILMHLHTAACLHPMAPNRLSWFDDVHLECTIWRRMYKLSIPPDRRSSFYATLYAARFI